MLLLTLTLSCFRLHTLRPDVFVYINLVMFADTLLYFDINPELFQTAHPAPVADVFVYINLVMFQTAHPTPVTCILTLTL